MLRLAVSRVGSKREYGDARRAIDHLRAAAEIAGLQGKRAFYHGCIQAAREK